MESLNKLILNNKIVDMRHSVKQSRIQSINKLVKEIKKLRNRKGTDEQKAKSANKAERYVECIQIMKKVKEDDVSKFALMNEKSLAEITNNVNESPEIKAIARIADHRPIYNQVKAFREKYPDWKETLPLLFDTLGEKYQEKKKYRKSSKNKAKVKLTENKTIKSSRYQEKTPNVTYIHNKLGTWRVEESEPSRENDIVAVKPAPEISICDSGKNDFAVIKSHQIMNIHEIPHKSSEDNKKVEKDESFEKLTDSVANEIKKDGYIKKISKAKNVEKPRRENENSISDEKITKTIDPFFVTKDNKEYLSVNVVSSTSNVEENRSDVAPKKFNNFSSAPKSYEKSWKQPKINVPKKYPKIETKEETLHPSWEAKRKQASITKFQGKKVKFDD